MWRQRRLITCNWATCCKLWDFCNWIHSRITPAFQTNGPCFMRFGICCTGINSVGYWKGIYAFCCWRFRDCIAISQPRESTRRAPLRRRSALVTLIRRHRNGKSRRRTLGCSKQSLIYYIATNSRTRRLKSKSPSNSKSNNSFSQRSRIPRKSWPSITEKDCSKKQRVLSRTTKLRLRYPLMGGSRIRICWLSKGRLN